MVFMRDLRVIKRTYKKLRTYVVMDYDNSRKQVGKKFTNKKQALYFRDQVLVGEITESDHKKYFQVLKLIKK